MHDPGVRRGARRGASNKPGKPASTNPRPWQRRGPTLFAHSVPVYGVPEHTHRILGPSLFAHGLPVYGVPVHTHRILLPDCLLIAYKCMVYPYTLTASSSLAWRLFN